MGSGSWGLSGQSDAIQHEPRVEGEAEAGKPSGGAKAEEAGRATGATEVEEAEGAAQDPEAEQAHDGVS